MAKRVKRAAKTATEKTQGSASLTEDSAELDAKKSRILQVIEAMTPDERLVLRHLTELRQRIARSGDTFPAVALEIKQFIGDQFGRDTDFYRSLEKSQYKGTISAGEAQRAVLALYSSITSGRYRLGSLRDKAEAEVTGDILSQAESLFGTKGLHHAAAVVLVGAALEEFLRTWCRRLDILPTSKHAGIEHYKGSLRNADRITENDAKDITAWAAKRNSVAHGRFEEVGREEARLMLDQVRAFMRKYE